MERESESILKRVNLRPCRVSSRPKDSRGAGTPLRPELPCYDTNSPLRPETTNAGSGCSLAQQVIDVFLPSRRSDEVRCARILPAWSRHAAFPFCSATESRVCHALRRATFPQWPAAAT